MAFLQWGSRTNETVNAWASKVDGPTGLAARDATGALVLAVRVLRWPTLFLLVITAPILIATGLIAGLSDGPVATIAAIVLAVEVIVWGAFSWRRLQILRAIEDPEDLATQIGVAAQMSGRPAEIAGELTSLAKQGGVKLMSRLRAMWSRKDPDVVWIRNVSDLDRARWFFPPTIGHTALMAVAMLWLVPVSAVVGFLLFVAAIAN